MASQKSGWISDRGVRGVVYQNKRILPKQGWLEPQGAVVAFEDFIADHIAEDSTVTVNQSGTPTTAAAISATAGPTPVGHGGWLAGSVDNVDAEIDEIALGAKPWLNASRATDQLIVCEVGFVIPSALTARQYFFGFSDDETEGTATNGPLNIQTGTTLVDVADDAAGFIYSSLATDADGFYMAATKATVGGTPVISAAGSLETVAVDNYIKLRVEIDSDGDVYFYGAEDLGTANRTVETVFIGAQAAAVTADILYVPIFTAAATTTTAVEWEIDYLFGAGPA
jgi:hypothetical protein